MRYDETRAKKLIQYIHKMGIRTCVYCNAQYAITFVSDEESFATYDLDHVWAKSSYPFLCTSFFNLVPSCPYCNKLKSKNPSDFNLYTEDEKEIDPFEFRLTRASKLKYYLSNQDDDLEISMAASDKGDQTNAANHNLLFHIDQIYSSHKDVVAEIIADLFGDNASATLANTINNMSISLVLGTQPTTGFLSLIDSTNYQNATVATLDDMINTVDITSVTLGTMVEKQIISQSALESAGVDLSSPKWDTLKTMTLVDIITAYYNALP